MNEARFETIVGLVNGELLQPGYTARIAPDQSRQLQGAIDELIDWFPRIPSLYPNDRPAIDVFESGATVYTITANPLTLTYRGSNLVLAGQRGINPKAVIKFDGNRYEVGVKIRDNVGSQESSYNFGGYLNRMRLRSFQIIREVLNGYKEVANTQQGAKLTFEI